MTAKKVLRFAGRALAFLTALLIMDYLAMATLFSGMKRRWNEAYEANLNAYIGAPYHHDLRPDEKSTRIWGRERFSWQTDKYGFRVGQCAPGDAEKDRKAIFVIGDSFVEALGSSYERSFVGLMACDAARQGKAVWNLGVASYSPVIYFRKISAVAEKLGIKPAEIFVFLDPSDIDDDANVYRVGDDGIVRFADPGRPVEVPFDLGQFAIDNLATARLLYSLYLASTFSESNSLGRDRARWAFDPGLMEKWGKRGLEVAAGNLDKIVDLCRDWQCRMTLVVYPWPDHIAARDRDSIQVRYWRDWSTKRHVGFIDGFAPFFHDSADAVLAKYFLPGDVHFTAAGNQLFYEVLRKAVGGDW
jgi:hypothetical protein